MFFNRVLSDICLQESLAWHGGDVYFTEPNETGYSHAEKSQRAHKGTCSAKRKHLPAEKKKNLYYNGGSTNSQWTN